MCKQGRSQHRATAAKINDCRNKNFKLFFGFSDPRFNSCLSLTTLYSVRVANLVSENKSAYTFSLFKENVYSNGIICYSQPKNQPKNTWSCAYRPVIKPDFHFTIDGDFIVIFGENEVKSYCRSD